LFIGGFFIFIHASDLCFSRLIKKHNFNRNPYQRVSFFGVTMKNYTKKLLSGLRHFWSNSNEPLQQQHRRLY
jgi:lipoate-protein ligase A